MDNLLLHVIVLCLCGAIKDVFGQRRYEEGGRIVGGVEVSIQDYPYQAYLILEDALGNLYSCGGSILNSRHILTAAHCVENRLRVYARVGSTFTDTGGQMVNSSSYTMHPQYNPQTFNNDIAIVRLINSITINGNTTRAVILPEANSDPLPGTNIVVTGWGDTSEGGSGSRTLMAVSVPVVSRPNCNDTYSGTITENMICAGEEEGGKDSCQGDSGGPAVENGIQLGVVSFGLGCAQPGIPGVYTRVSKYRTFIKATSGA